jgi:radical SAM superfamily enzyme YgiQ (UPF0313 family)
MKVVLISTYELGRQPFGLASPAAWLRARGHEVFCADVSISPLPSAAVRDAGLIAFYLPMHTATRLAGRVIEKVRELNGHTRLAAYGLYAPLNREYLHSLGVDTVIGGEFEAVLADLADSLDGGYEPVPQSFVPLDRLTFIPPDRAGLPSLTRYAKLTTAEGDRTVGYTEASRGCKHFCRHCPVVPVYQGAFRVVQQEVVLRDIRSQVENGAQHITFGDPDFFNGPTHAIRIIEALHREFPDLSYDVTIKVEHLLKNRGATSVLKDTGCLFVTSAVESVDDDVLVKLDKGHTRRDLYDAVELCRSVGLLLNPTFIAFMPWTTRAGYLDLLTVIRDLDLVDQVSPVQLGLRLLITSGSRLLELEEVRSLVGEFDRSALAWTWKHPDPAMDDLARAVLLSVARGQKSGRSRRQLFGDIWNLATDEALPDDTSLLPRAAVPYLNEPWYC